MKHQILKMIGDPQFDPHLPLKDKKHETQEMKTDKCQPKDTFLLRTKCVVQQTGSSS